MVIVMRHDATEAEVEAVAARARAAGGEAFISRGAVHTIVGLVGDPQRFEGVGFAGLDGVDRVIVIGQPYKMVARDLHPGASTVSIGGTPIGDRKSTRLNSSHT